jgi:hypothetical protein
MLLLSVGGSGGGVDGEEDTENSKYILESLGGPS